MEENLTLTQAWDKTFPKSEKVDHRKVNFHNRYVITLAADLSRNGLSRTWRACRPCGIWAGTWRGCLFYNRNKNLEQTLAPGFYFGPA